MMKRLMMLLCLLALPAMACNLTDAPTPAPTIAPPPVLQNPVVGLNPVSGAPGTVITVGAAGFPAGSKVNLSVSPINTGNVTGSSAPVAQSLTIGAGGYLTFAYQLPDNFNGTAISNNTTLNFTVSTIDNISRANAIFIAVSGNGTPTATSQSADNSNTGGSGGSLTGLFITSPAISATVFGSAVTVTGSGHAFNNRVGVQMLDANYKVLGSALATIQAGTGAVGPWEVTVGFPQPGAPAVGYIVAYTVNAQGSVAEQASIPVTLAGGAVSTAAPSAIPTIAPTVPPVITGGPTIAPTVGGFITATPK